MASAGPPLSLPGAGASLTRRPDITFPLAIFDEQKVWFMPSIDSRDRCRKGAMLLTCREIELMACMDKITDKPDWDRNVFDDEIVAKWRIEIVTPAEIKQGIASHSTTNNEHDTDEVYDDGGLPESVPTTAAQDHGFSPRMFDWAIAELSYKARLLPRINCIEVLDGVWKSDTIVSSSLQESLRGAIARLEDLPAKDLDWHPGSHSKILDIVHPSMYSLVYGVSRVLMDSSLKCGVNGCLSWVGQGSTTSRNPYSQPHTGAGYSSRYQWLPSEIQCSLETGAVEIRSYINNLHPLQETTAVLYPLLEKLIESAIPLWNRTLSPFKTNQILPPRINDWSNSFEGYGYSFDSGEAPSQESGEEDDDFEVRYGDWKDDRTIVHPEPDSEGFRDPSLRMKKAYADYSDGIEKYWDVKPLVDLRRDDFGDGQRGRLQIIVKLVNIHLTPEKPLYEGGSWHVEGMGNESM